MILYSHICHPKILKNGQMAAKAGIKKCGQAVVAAMIKEFTQLNKRAVPDKPVVIPIDTNTLTVTEKNKSLQAINLIKEKRSRELKDRSCVDDSKKSSI